MGDQQIRRVRLNQPHQAQGYASTPSREIPIGHYEGDTMSEGVCRGSLQIGAISMIDKYGTPFSPAMHLVERIRLIDAGAANAATEQGGRDGGRVGVEMGGATIDPGCERSGAGNPVPRRGPDRLHHALVGQGHLSPCAGRT